MKLFKQIIQEAEDRNKKMGRIFRGRLSPKLERENIERSLQGIGGRRYTSIGHDSHDITLNPENIASIRRDVFGLHPETESKPTELWMHYRDPRVMENDKRKEGSILYHSLLNHEDSTVHDDVFDTSISHGPSLSGRIDHQRKSISISTLNHKHRHSFSSSSMDNIIKQLKDRHPDYDIVDFVSPANYGPRSREGEVMEQIVSFRKFISENSSVPYGRLQPHHDSKIEPNDKIISSLRKSGVLSAFENMKPPSDEHGLKEIEHLKSRMENLSDEDHQFAVNAETDEQGMYRKFAQSIGLNLPSHYVDKILDQTDPVLFHLKKHHNRGRPEQFAAANNIPYQPSITHTAAHPAYPSGHAFDSHIMEYILTKLKPEAAGEISDFTRRMRESRLNAGLHYPSDNDISEKLAKAIINTGLIDENI